MKLENALSFFCRKLESYDDSDVITGIYLKIKGPSYILCPFCFAYERGHRSMISASTSIYVEFCVCAECALVVGHATAFINCEVGIDWASICRTHSKIAYYTCTGKVKLEA